LQRLVQQHLVAGFEDTVRNHPGGAEHTESGSSEGGAHFAQRAAIVVQGQNGPRVIAQRFTMAIQIASMAEMNRYFG